MPFCLSQILHVRLRHQIFLSLQRDSAFPSGMQQVFEGFRARRFRHQLRVVSDRVRNQVKSDPVALFVDEPGRKISGSRRQVAGDDISLHEDAVGVIVDENHVGTELVSGHLAKNLRRQRFAGSARILGFDERIAPLERLGEFVKLRRQRGAVDDQLALVLRFGDEIFLCTRRGSRPLPQQQRKRYEHWKSGFHETSPLPRC